MLNKLMLKARRKVSVYDIAFIITLCFSFYTRIGKNYNVNYFVKLIIATFWVLIALIKLLKINEFKLLNITKYILSNKRMFIFVIPVLGLTIYNSLLVIFGQAELAYIGRMVSNLYSMLICVAFSLSSLFLFGKKTFQLMLYAIILNFISLVLINFCMYGTDCFYQILLSIIGNVNANNGFEVHDLTFAVGILSLILFLMYKNKFKYLIFLSVIMLFGFKRIQLLTIIVCFVIYLFLKIMSDKLKISFMLCINILFIIFSFIYIISIKDGILFQICDFLGIETMGRLSLYKWISNYFEITPFFFGIGIGSTFKMAETLTTWGIAALHSDILRMFVENGFIMFFIWMVYYLIYIPLSILKNKNFKLFNLYFFVTLYLFLIHLTDNTVLYFVTQYVYSLSILYFLKYENVQI